MILLDWISGPGRYSTSYQPLNGTTCLGKDLTTGVSRETWTNPYNDRESIHNQEDFMSRQAHDLRNKKFGMLQPIRRVHDGITRDVVWECRCDCGNLHEVRSRQLKDRRRPTTNCGCQNKRFKRNNVQEVPCNGTSNHRKQEWPILVENGAAGNEIIKEVITNLENNSLQMSVSSGQVIRDWLKSLSNRLREVLK